MRFGDIIRDQGGAVMECGQGAEFIVLSHSPEGKKEDEMIKVIELGKNANDPITQITHHPLAKLEKLKHVANIYKLVWDA